MCGKSLYWLFGVLFYFLVDILKILNWWVIFLILYNVRIIDIIVILFYLKNIFFKLNKF